MYKPNFNSELPWPKVLDLMNELLEHEIEASGSNGEIEYIIIELNQETKDTLCRLGIKLNEIDNEFCDLEEGWLDITSAVWGDIAWHYGQQLWYTGEKFIVYTEAEKNLLETLKMVRPYLPGAMITHDMGQCEKCGNPTRSGVYKYCDKCLHKKVNNVISKHDNN